MITTTTRLGRGTPARDARAGGRPDCCTPTPEGASDAPQAASTSPAAASAATRILFRIRSILAGY
jgi:hypothetical protein